MNMHILVKTTFKNTLYYGKLLSKNACIRKNSDKNANEYMRPIFDGKLMWKDEELNLRLGK